MKFDLAVIGAGPGGYTGAIRAAQLGLKTCIIEKDSTLGGTCLNVGCIPSKALLDSSEHYHFALSDSATHGIRMSSVKLDLSQMMNRKNKIVSDLTNGVSFLMKKNKIEKIKGTATIKSAQEIVINGKQTIQAKNILIATGSAPRELPFAPFDSKTILSSTEALCLEKVPKKMIVIGGGFIGLEMSSVWSRLGSEVHILEYSSRLCPTLDKEISSELFKTLKKQGFNFHLQSKVTQVQTKGSSVKVTYEQESKSKELTGDVALVSIGRVPYTESLGLKDLGVVMTEQNFISVNDNFQTSIPSIYAIGDVIGGAMLAHKAEEEGVAVAEIVSSGHGHVNYKTLPSVIYTWPEVASVGLTQEQCEEKGISIKKGKFPFMANGRAKALGCIEGFVKVISHAQTDEVLGVHVIGPRASDMIAEAVVAMEFSANSEDIAKSFHAHPTLSEVMREASLAVHSKARQI